MASPEAALEVPDHVVEYLSEQRTMTLATASPAGVPHASTFLYVNDGPTLYFWSKPNTTTARHVEQNPVVSFAIDEYTEDLRQTKGVQGAGECRVLLSGEEIARVADLFGQRFPDLSPGNTMSISFFRIAPTDLQFIDNSQSEPEKREGVFGAEFHKERAYSVFSDLPVLVADSVSVSLQTTRADAGEVIVREGGPADKYFVVVEGEVEVVRDAEGQSETLDTFGPGHFFGEVTIMRDLPRAATVRATKPTTLLSMDRDTFRALVAQSLGTTEDFDRVIQERLGRPGS
jgi:nitroimidazol reductase NimA-like FMN-containing flavoprotein (pyridoxamine 5'-phosphate oxidase superfamily)